MALRAMSIACRGANDNPTFQREQQGVSDLLETTVIDLNHDLDRLVAQINQAQWDEANEMSTYDSESLRAYLERQDTLFVACHEVNDGEATLLGFASSRFELKPYGKELWLYVDELDVCANQRRKGAGAAIMSKLFELADEADCEELWLGTEVENNAANGLYRSLAPDDVAQVVGYTWDLEYPDD